MCTRRRLRIALHRFLETFAFLIAAIMIWVHIEAQRIDRTDPITATPTGGTTAREQLHLDGKDTLDDMVLVIKTGATESLRKLPIHLETTLLRWPHVLLLSDFNEEIDGHRVYDALEIITESVRVEEPSFKLWYQLRKEGRSALNDMDPETGEQIQWLATSSSQRQDGWRLARFMNLPMAVKALEYKNNAKWYIFIDADTYVSWSNMLRLVRHLNSSIPIYAGSQVPMASNEFFAHGGSGYILSQPALVAVEQYYWAQQLEWDLYAQSIDFGEVPLARALLNLDIPLTWSYPQFQGGDPFSMDFGLYESGRKLWCYPAVTYHHVSAEALRALWRFEDRWNRPLNAKRPFRHSDVFKSWILPELKISKSNWDNYSPIVVDDVASMAACRAYCQGLESCVQYSFHENRCRTGAAPMLGYSKAGASSGWMLDRIQRLVQDLDRQCEDSIFV